MGLRIYNNVDAQVAHRALQQTNDQMSKAMERLSSGLRINRAADDAAGLAVSEVMRSQIRGQTVASQNAQDGVSLVQVADGAMGTAVDMLQRLRDLSVQASNGTLTDAQRGNLDKEAQNILAEVNKVGTDTDFNGIKILSGSVAASAVTLQVGADASQSVAFTIATVSTSDLGISGIAVSSQASATAAIASIDAAINTLTTARANVGSIQNRLEQTISRLGVTTDNLSAAESRIRDADMATEMINFTKTQILQQSGTAMLAQANQAPQTILSLLR
jgi:flagellin